DQVDQLLQECEFRLAQHDEIASLLTTVATEPGQLINEADIFVHMIPQDERKIRQQDLMRQGRVELERSHDLRIVGRDQSTEGFTAQRGDPVDFAIQGDWKKLPGYATQIMDAMASSGMVQDIDCDYRPGMPEVQIYPNREKLAAVGVPVGRMADTMMLF